MMTMASSDEQILRTTPSPADFSGTRREDVISQTHFNLDNEEMCVINEKSIRTTRDSSGATKIKLNFSVDRLLSDDRDCRRENREFEHSRYTHNLSQVAHQHHHDDDPQSLVRPMPIRPLGNSPRPAQVISTQIHHPFGILSQAMLKYHHQHSQTSLNNLLGPLSSLKSIQINQSHYRQPNLQHTKSNEMTTALVSSMNPAASSTSTCSSHQSGKRKRSWSRAVFSNLQRKGLEIQFQQQKYITKPDRRKLAARLNLTDAQVKVWFQNRRMKWRHTRENLKSGQEKPSPISTLSTKERMASQQSGSFLASCSSTSDSECDEEIDVVE